MTNTRNLPAIAVVLLTWVGLPGCVRLFDKAFAPGDYGGDLACTMQIVAPDGQSDQEEFASSVTVSIDSEGTLSVNGVELVIGQSVLRSTPTADLAFEVTAITNEAEWITVTLEPRPTLVGITIDGSLVERYQWSRGSIVASSAADLLVTDVSGTSELSVTCNGALEAQ